jgi:hypothetical protein
MSDGGAESNMRDELSPVPRATEITEWVARVREEKRRHGARFSREEILALRDGDRR